MKLLVFGDTHGRSLALVKKKAKEADLIICIGDISNFEDTLKENLKEISSWGKRTLLVHGNHEDENIMKRFCEKHDHLYFIHDGFFKTENFIFLGYGGGGFSHADNAFEKRTATYKQFIKNLDFFLVLHQPPYGVVDVVHESHTGNKSFAQFIRETKPQMVFCGHIHECNGQRAKLGESLVVNVLPDGILFDV